MKRLIAVILTLCLAASSARLGEETRISPGEWQRIQADLMDEGNDPVPEQYRIAARPLPWFAPWPEEGFQTILLLSSDAPDMNENYGRASVVLLCTIELATGKIRLLSLPEKAPVQLAGLPEKVWFKFTNCFGGPLLMMETVSDTLQLPVNRYCAVNLNAFVQTMDRLGGAALELTREEAEALGLEPGPQCLTGDQALRYVRLRWGDRTRRVRQLIGIVERNVLGSATIHDGLMLLDFLCTAIDTNLTMDDLISAVYAVLGQEERLPVSYLALPDLDGGEAPKVRDFLYGKGE